MKSSNKTTWNQMQYHDKKYEKSNLLLQHVQMAMHSILLKLNQMERNDLRNTGTKILK